MSSAERQRLSGSVPLGEGSLRFSIDKLAELQEKTGRSLGEVLAGIRGQDIVLLRDALSVGAEGDLGDPPVTEALAAVVDAITLAVFGPDGPPKVEEGDDDDRPPPQGGNGAIRSDSPSPA